MLQRRNILLIVIFVLLAGAAAAGYRFSVRATPTAPPQLSAADPLFVDEATEAGLDFRMHFLPGEQGETFKINLYDHGCGVAVGDYDGDGYEDLYLLNQLGPNALFHNRGDGTFEDATEEMGLALDDRISVAATFADYDNDGDQDLYVTSTRGGNLLYRNEDGRRFTDVTAEAGLEHVGHSQSAVFFDYDRDGLLDLYVVQTAEWTDDSFDEEDGYFLGKDKIWAARKEQNRLYHNQGNGSFVDVTDVAKLGGRGWSGDAVIFDYDEDGWLDVLVVCMFGRAQLYRNQQDGSFRDVTLDVLGKTPWGGTGAKVLDFNNDGILDVYVVDMHSDMWMGLDYSNSYYETAVESEKIKFEYSYGPRTDDPAKLAAFEKEVEDILDFRHDEVLFGNALYKGLGGGKFEEVSAETNMENFWPWGLATGDFDNDGYLDVFVTAGMGYPFLYWHNYLMMNAGNGYFEDKSFSLGIEPPVGGNYLPETIRGAKCSRSSRCAATGDFDGDGKLDLVVNNFNHGPYYFRNRGRDNHFIAFQLQGTQSNRDAIGAQVRLQRGSETLLRQVQSAGGYLSCSSKTVHFGLGKEQNVDQVEIIWPSGIRQTIKEPHVDQLHEIEEPAAEQG